MMWGFGKFHTSLFTIVHIYTVFVTESCTSYNIFFTSARGILYFRDRIYFVVTHNIYVHFVTKYPLNILNRKRWFWGLTIEHYWAAYFPKKNLTLWHYSLVVHYIGIFLWKKCNILISSSISLEIYNHYPLKMKFYTALFTSRS